MDTFVSIMDTQNDTTSKNMHHLCTTFIKVKFYMMINVK
jgi:hypothetical protein